MKKLLITFGLFLFTAQLLPMGSPAPAKANEPVYGKVAGLAPGSDEPQYGTVADAPRYGKVAGSSAPRRSNEPRHDSFAGLVQTPEHGSVATESKIFNTTPYTLNIQLANISTGRIIHHQQLPPMNYTTVELPETETEYKLNVSGENKIEQRYSISNNISIVTIRKEPINIKIGDKPTETRVGSTGSFSASQQTATRASTLADGTIDPTAHQIPRIRYGNLGYRSIFISNLTPYLLTGKISSDAGEAFQQINPMTENIEFGLAPEQANPTLTVNGTISFEANATIPLINQSIAITMNGEPTIKITARYHPTAGSTSTAAASNVACPAPQVTKKTAIPAQPKKINKTAKSKGKAAIKAQAKAAKAAAKAQAKAATKARSSSTSSAASASNASAIAAAAAAAVRARNANGARGFRPNPGHSSIR